ncbi:MAG: STAS domain-containing protein [Bacteroidota bacterium]
MIRITRVDESPLQVTLKVEGQIVSDSIPVLKHECLASKQRNQGVVLDFSDVTCIDSLGVKMLKKIRSENLQIVNCSNLIDDCLKS